MKNSTLQFLGGAVRLKLLILAVLMISSLTVQGQTDVDLSDHPEYGHILTDKDGNSLYFFSRDAFGESECEGACIENWPLFYAESLSAGDGLDENDFSSFDRGDGVMQTTYKGWPLYYFINDADSGDVNGDNVNGVWFVAKPDYTIMLVNSQLIGNNGVNYKGDYTEGEEIIQYFTDGKGLTLYTWINDNFNKNNFTAEDFGNNAAWPIYEETEAVVPSSLENSDFYVIEVSGRSQLTYKGWPLYYFGQDNEQRGMTKGVSVPSPGVWPVAVAGMDPAMPATVVDIIVGSDEHGTLATAVTAAGLVETLQGAGPFTVFAPTDAAFAALPDGTLEALLDDAEGALTDILLYHVVSGKAMSADLSDGQEIETVFGADIVVTINEDGVFINDAQVTVADLEAENGVVHVIDAVLIPEAEEDPMPATVVDIIVGSDDHGTLATAVTAAGLVETLQGAGPFTVFAPTDAAFAALPDGTLEALLDDAEGALTDILLYHVVAGKAMSTDLSDGQEIETVFGANIVVTINEDGVFINDAQVTVADLEAENGVVHVIDAVLIPEVTSAERFNDFRQMDATIYPNPARDYVNISFQLTEMQDVALEIYSITGERISFTNLGMLPAGDNNISKPVSDFQTGTYIVRISTNTESIVLRLQVVN